MPESNICNEPQNTSPQNDSVIPRDSAEKQQEKAIASCDGVNFTTIEKGFIICLASLALVSSKLPEQIYFPSLIDIAKDLNTTTTLVDSSISFYRLIQAFAPTIWGALSDQWGRRPTLVVTMAINTVCCAGTALSPNIGTLIGTRMVHAVGASAIQVIGMAVATDVSVPETRAGYISYFQLGFRFSTTFGPVLGGIIAQHLSWRWSFWIMCFYGSFTLICIIILLPETLRSLAGGLYNPTLIQWTKRLIQSDSNEIEKGVTSVRHAEARNRYRRRPDFREPYRYLLLPDFFLIMLLTAIYFSVQGCFMISTPYLYQGYYNLNVQSIGLCFLPQAIGSIFGSICGAHCQNYAFRKAAEKYDGDDTDKKTGKSNTLPLDFPIYQTRLASVWPNAIAAQILTALLGWLFMVKTHIAVPLTIQFIVSANIIFLNSATKSLLGDLRPNKGASVSAANCLMWNLLMAGGSVAMNPAIKAIGAGWAYTILSSLMVVSNLAIVALMKFGVKWRTKQNSRSNL
ncbi:major facilitator superfamily domain-containing protein [Fennellomyces sp. T-0311]|nr:major facilitator superfamily domain-containing protein [Fennellomyces sp. T-0311]